MNFLYVAGVCYLATAFPLNLFFPIHEIFRIPPKFNLVTNNVSLNYFEIGSYIV